MGWLSIHFVFFLVMFFSEISYVFSKCNPEDREALFQFLNSFERTSPSCPVWEKSQECCNEDTGWEGISCDKNNRVTRVDIGCRFLKGTISSNSSIFKLRYLQYVDLSTINLQLSSIPSQFGSLPDLTWLTLNGNNLKGAIPPAICKANKLQKLDLDSNQLTGVLPSCLFKLPNLQYLSLSQNRVKGSIPSSISSNVISFVGIAHNQLQGGVPAWLFTSPTLTSFSLANNSLTGPIQPFKKPTRTSLTSISLQFNKISGSVPSGLVHLVNVSVIELQQNRLQGNLPQPPEGTTILLVGNNRLSGTIPLKYCSLRDLRELDVSFNNLTGVVPSCLLDKKDLNLNVTGNSLVCRGKIC